MADNRYSRRHASRIADLPENDPLAELARIVGFEAGRPGEAARAEPSVDLEAELLAELEAFDAAARTPLEDRSAALPQVAPVASADAADYGRGEDGGDSLLEDELLRDIEGRSAGREAEEPFSPAGTGVGMADWPSETNVFADRLEQVWPRAEAGDHADDLSPHGDLAVEELFNQADEEPGREGGQESNWVGQEAPSPVSARGEAGEPDFDFDFGAEDFIETDDLSREASTPATAEHDVWADSDQDRDRADDFPPAFEAPSADGQPFDDDRIAGSWVTENEPADPARSSAAGEVGEMPDDFGAPERGAEPTAEAGPESWLKDFRLDDSVGGIDAAAPAVWQETQWAADNVVPLRQAAPDAWTTSPDAEDGDWQAGPPDAEGGDWQADPADADGGDWQVDPAVANRGASDELAVDHAALEAALEADIAAVYEDLQLEADAMEWQSAAIDPDPAEASSDPGAQETASAGDAPDAGAFVFALPSPATPSPAAAAERKTEPAVSADALADGDDDAAGPGSDQGDRPWQPSYDGERLEADRAGFDAFDFDPASLSEADEPVEPIGELDVPRLPIEDEPVAIAPVTDEFELDIDHDFGDLLADVDPAPLPGEPAALAMRHDADPAAGPARGAVAPTAIGPAATEQFSGVPVALSPARGPILEGEGDSGFGEDFDVDLSEPNVSYAAAPRVAPAPAARFASRRSLMLGVSAAALLLVAGVGAVLWHGSGASGEAGSGGPKVIAADSRPIKQKPANPGGKQVPNQNKIVYDSVDGTISQTPQQKSLLASGEQPADVVQRTLDPDVLPLNSPARTEADATAKAPPSVGKGQDRLAADTPDAASPEATVPQGLQPQQVETMIVTADGKLVPRSPSSDGASDGGDEGSPAAAAPASAAATAAKEAPALAPTSGAAAAPLAPAPAATRAPLPSVRPQASRPAATPSAPASPPARPAAQAPAPIAQAPAAPSPATPSPANQAPAAQSPAAAAPGGYLIQIAAQPTEAGAQASYQNMLRRYGTVIGGHGVDIKRVEISGKGVYYRVRIPAGSRQQAISMCESYKGAGGSCFVTR